MTGSGAAGVPALPMSSGQNLRTVSMPGFVVVPSLIFHSVVNGTPDTLDSSCTAPWPISHSLARTLEISGIDMFMPRESTVFGNYCQPYPVCPSHYRASVSNIGKIVAANAEALMVKHYGKVNVSQLAAQEGLSVGVAGRIKAGAVIQTNKLEALAVAFSLEPWQVLVPGLDPEAPPRLAGDASEWPLDMVDKRRYLGLSKRARDLAQGYLLRIIEDLEAKEKKASNGSGVP